jgi:hypothetical protein
MNKHTKEVIPYADLLAKVQSLLVCYPECSNIHIDSIAVHQEQVDGANWHISTFRRSGDDNDLTACRQKIAAEIRLLRASYDVAPK